MKLHKLHIKNFISIFFAASLILFSLNPCVALSKNKNQKNAEDLNDGIYEVSVSLKGGSGKTKIISPAKLIVKNKKQNLQIVLSSKNYDYIIVDKKKYLNESPNEFSSFTFPIKNTKENLKIIANTNAMSSSHEIEYEIIFNSGISSTELFESENFSNKNLENKNLKSKSAKTKTSKTKNPQKENQQNLKTQKSKTQNLNESSSVNFKDLKITKKLDLTYAKEFSVDFYGDYKLITISGKDKFFLVPENFEVPKNLPKDFTILKQPLDKTYLVSSSVIDFITTLDALDFIKFSGIKENALYIPQAKDAMQNKKILYAGKYNAPDYELLYSANCNLAIENTMIFHSPQVIEKLKELEIPVLVEKSTYENHPLGRLEWIKLYGLLFNREEIAQKFFDDENAKITSIIQNKNLKKTVVFFFITSNGSVNVRRPNDYIAKIINLSGGKYILDDLPSESENSLSTMNMQFENFYLKTMNADILIYNNTIDRNLFSMEDLLSKNEMFKDFKAYKENKIYCTQKNFFQEVTGLADFMQDLNKIFSDDDSDLKYIRKLNSLPN